MPARPHRCAAAICTTQIMRGVLCDEHWKEVPGWLRREIALERDDVRKANVRDPRGDQHLTQLYRLAIAEVDKKHAARSDGRAAVAQPAHQ